MEEISRQETVAAKRKLHTGRCTSGSCTCERYEFKAHADGFDHCYCYHTQWSHAKQEGTVDS